jgi:hypothetical protein
MILAPFWEGGRIASPRRKGGLQIVCGLRFRLVETRRDKQIRRDGAGDCERGLGVGDTVDVILGKGQRHVS